MNSGLMNSGLMNSGLMNSRLTPRISIFLFCLFAVITPAWAQSTLYAVNTEDNKVSVIDLQAGKMTGEISVSAAPQDLVISEDRRRLFVSSAGSNTVDVVDRGTLKVSRSVAVGAKPGGMALSPNGRFLFVCVRGGASVDVVDTASLVRVKSIPVGKAPGRIYVTPDGTRLITTIEDEQKLVVLNVRSQAKEFEIPVLAAPVGVVIEADRYLVIKRLFVQSAGGFELIDYAARKSGGKFTAAGAAGMGIAPDRKSVWVTNSPVDSVTAFALPDLAKGASVPAGTAPGDVVFAADGKYLYAANTGSNDVSVIDAVTYRAVKRIPAGRKPRRIIVD